MPALALLVLLSGVILWVVISTSLAGKIGDFVCDTWSKIVGNEDKSNNKKEDFKE